MNKSTDYQSLVQLRRRHYLKLKDVAYITGIDTANLSRFEKGKPYSRAYLHYGTLFKLSSDISTWQSARVNYKELIHRCFSLLEQIENLPKTYKNLHRSDGVNTVIKNLTVLDEAYGG